MNASKCDRAGEMTPVELSEGLIGRTLRLPRATSLAGATFAEVAGAH